MRIKYGLINNNIDITDICLSKFKKNNTIIIPANDEIRCTYFTDPIFGTLKSIFIIDDDNNISEYEHYYMIRIDMLDKKVTTVNINNINDKISNIHSKINIKYGTMKEEFPEQKMVTHYLTGNEKVLEIGGNIGRNSLVISHILGVNSSNLVTLESDMNIANRLTENRDLNNFKFHVESSALSKRKLIQRGWASMVSDTLQDGYNWVNTITLDELKSKYNIQFDTLVLDCEGAFYYILMDMPEILDNIKLIIMENDYREEYKKQYIDDILTKNNFYVDYIESGIGHVERGGWTGFCPCYDNFFEVWKRDIL
jgi:FkbM family methyltransferase